MNAASSRPRVVATSSALLLVLVLCAPTRAHACSACACGDPTLTSLGTEQPFAGRVRLAGDLQYRSDGVGQPGVDALHLHEMRLGLTGVFAPTDALIVSATAPVLLRQLTFANLRQDQVTGLGDVDLRGKLFVLRAGGVARKHLLAVQVGLKIPTGPLLKDESGRPLPADLQPGTGTLDGGLGLAYAFFARPWSWYASAFGGAPMLFDPSMVPGASLRTTAAVQREVTKKLSARLGIDTRLERPTYMNGVRERDSGGFIAFASPELLFSPGERWLLFGSARVPFLNLLSGHHREGAFLSMGAVFDL